MLLRLVFFQELPGVESLIELALKNEVSSFVKTTTLAPESEAAGKARPMVVIPKTGVSPDELRGEMKILQNKEANAERDGNIFALTYTVNDDNYKLQKEAFDSFEGEYKPDRTIILSPYCLQQSVLVVIAMNSLYNHMLCQQHMILWRTIKTIQKY